jgi:hypothetical protein
MVKRPIWVLLHPKMDPEALGNIPYWLDEDDPDPAWKQIDKNYHHGGGWHSFDGFIHRGEYVLVYPGDPNMSPLARCQLRDEAVVFYRYSWVGIFQKDGSFDVARID